MAKKSTIIKNNRRKAMVQAFNEKRAQLKKIARDRQRSYEERAQAREQLALLPLNSSPVRVRNRCEITGRPRGYFRFFGMSRIAVRELALKGDLPGVRKGNY